MESRNPLTLDSTAEKALFSGDLLGLVAVCHENERPLQGLAGRLDWRFHGEISKYIRRGAITGKLGECAYIPIRRHKNLYHLFFVGGGSSPEPGARKFLGDEPLQTLKANLGSLKLEKIGVSASDLGLSSPQDLRGPLKGLKVWLVQ